MSANSYTSCLNLKHPIFKNGLLMKLKRKNNFVLNPRDNYI